jgi:hypothetical protein
LDNTPLGEPDAGKIEFYTSDVDNGQTNGLIIASVRDANDQWSAWRKLDTTDCDDFQRGKRDKFPDFVTVARPWKDLAIHICSTDGWTFGDIVWYDDGGSSKIERFCDNIGMGDTSSSCPYNEISNLCCGGSIGAYNGWFLDGDGGCLTMIVKLEGVNNLEIGYEGNADGLPPFDCGATALDVNPLPTLALHSVIGICIGLLLFLLCTFTSIGYILGYKRARKSTGYRGKSLPYDMVTTADVIEDGNSRVVLT